MDKETASIMFMPVCTKFIWQEIDGRQSIGVVCGSPRLMGATHDISPDKCPHCGALSCYTSSESRIPVAFPYIVPDTSKIVKKPLKLDSQESQG